MVLGSTNHYVDSWVRDVASRLQPERVRWITGADEESREINALLVREGTFVPLDPKSYPASFWCRSDPFDVARVEEKTFICSRSRDDAGPTNNWADPVSMYELLNEKMVGCMKGRTMYVVPYLMGPDGSPYSRVGFEITDSAYVVANMRIMARVGEIALRNLSPVSRRFVRGVHSIGTLDANDKYVCHFPEDSTIISFNSNYGGNALQGKKCFALRIASVLGRDEGWLAEHMLILGLGLPNGEKHYVCAAFPSACGKTNLAMLVPPEPYRSRGYTVETVGDDIAWLNFGPDGRLYAINPEAGFFGVAPGTSEKTNPNAMAAIRGNTIFTNTALDLDAMTPWWEGMGDPPRRVRDWLGDDMWTAESGRKAAHPNSRFTAPASQCPSISSAWEAPQGVPISAIIFGGRRARVAPLVFEALSWRHGVYVGLTMASETTAAAAGTVGRLRRDPMAMRPFVGYHIGDYLRHWLYLGQRKNVMLPKIFHVNWFRTDSTGIFLWPGFGDNMRVLEWVLGRVRGSVEAVECPIGLIPREEDLNLDGANVTSAVLRELLAVQKDDWYREIQDQENYLRELGPHIPKEMWDEWQALKARFGRDSV